MQMDSPTSPTMPTLSCYIYRVLDFLVSNGATVDLYDKSLPDNIHGRCDYGKSLVSINCPSAKDALYAIIHEGGHWMSYIRRRDNGLSYSRLQREQFAYTYGWALIVQFSIPITKAEWKAEEQFNIDSYLEDTKPTYFLDA